MAGDGPKVIEISDERKASIFMEMLSCRRNYCADGEFFKMTDVWADLASDESDVKIKKYRSGRLDGAGVKAGVIVFENRVTLVVPGELWDSAEKGVGPHNFDLAHELAHYGLDHHSDFAGIRNFKMTKRTHDVANIPDSVEELEANLGAVFFQCGIALLEANVDPVWLAKRAFTSVSDVKRAIKVCQRIEFKECLFRLAQPKPRQVF